METSNNYIFHLEVKLRALSAHWTHLIMKETPELDPRFWSSSVESIIQTIEQLILSADGPTDPKCIEASKMFWCPLHDAILDAGYDCGEFLHWISINNKFPYYFPEKHWMWYIPHQNNSKEDYEKFLASNNTCIPIQYREARSEGNECACHAKNLKDALTRIFALDPNNLPT